MSTIPLRLALVPAALAAAAASAAAQWTVAPVPFDPGWNRAVFEDVAALPDGTAWAVGYAQLPGPPTGSEEVTLAMHWDGAQWTHTPTPYVAPYPGGSGDSLHAVAAVGAHDVWAAGERYGDAGGLSVGAWLEVLHWDGSTWQDVPVPDPPGGSGINFSGPRVYDIAALASDDVWFAGLWGEPNANFTVTWRPLAMHWNGSGLTVFPTPTLFSGTNAMHLRQIAAVAPDDIWGICRTNTASGVTNQPAVLHWDGSAWAQVATPSLGSSVVLDDVVAVAADDVWVFGHVYFPSSPFALHWDGTSFQVVSGVPYASTAVALGPSEIYLGTSAITLFDGFGSTVVESFPGVSAPSVLGLDRFAVCGAWAVGRQGGNPVTGDLMPLAAFRTASAGCASIGQRFCAGDGLDPAVTTPCGALGVAGACRNDGAPGHGCANSVNPAGGELTAGGATSPDSVVLSASGMPATSACIYVQGDARTDAPFGDGVRCAGGTLIRLRTKVNSGGASEFPEAGDPSVSVRGQVTPGSGALRHYQTYYRNAAAAFCPDQTFNVTNGVSITW